ncbi:MAG: phosphonate C-P lyase system protein PhnH [Halocynthiibacter sp.]
MQNQALDGGFANPALQSAAAFRGVMDAMARPGSIQKMAGAQPPAPLSPAAGAAILTLCDAQTPIFLAGEWDTDEIRSWLAFHTGALIVGPSHCQFAIGAWSKLVPLSNYPIGTSEYPDRSATLIVELDDMTKEGAILAGPGIKDQTRLGLPEVEAFQTNAAQYPLGLDFIFTCADLLAALPRSTEVN